MKKIFFLALASFAAVSLQAQTAFDAYKFSQPDLKGTARFMSMGGAFTALGGDLSSLSQNPAGIGVYRSNEIGLTLDLDIQKTNSVSGDNLMDVGQTKFFLNNIGFVWTIKLPSATCPNINFGFTYNKTSSFSRIYKGNIDLRNSLTTLIADDANSFGYTGEELFDDPREGKDPYANTNASWLPILGYNSYLINEASNAPSTFEGQWTQTTKGFGQFDVLEKGGIDSYNIAIGGNIADIVFWGMDFDITHMSYSANPLWSERLFHARVDNLDNIFADWTLDNYYSCSGTGFNYKLGFIVKPIHELRLGFSFQTPTWYNISSFYNGIVDYYYLTENNDETEYYAATPDGSDNFNFTSPWKLNAGIGAVLFDKLIVSADYTWTKYNGMKFSVPRLGYDFWDYDNYYPPYQDYPYIENGEVFTPQPGISALPFESANQSIKKYYKSSNTFRLGLEYRVIPSISLRLGYSFVSSPFKTEPYKSSRDYSQLTDPSFRIDNTTNYITGGLGWRFGGFYLDLAYVYKHMSSMYHAYMAYPQAGVMTSPSSRLSFNSSQIILSTGFKF